jgi:hypothetical protein
MSKYDLKEVTEYIRQAAIARGIDPDIAVRVARSEGLARNTWQSNVRKNGIREPSYGPFQMLVGGPGTGFPTGLGNELLNRGIDPRDPANMNKVIDFALDTAARDGWRQWYGAAKAGIGRFDGIDRSRDRSQETQYASNTSASPPRTQPAVPDHIAREYGLLGQQGDVDAMARASVFGRSLYPDEDIPARDGRLYAPPAYNDQPMDAHGPVSPPRDPRALPSRPEIPDSLRGTPSAPSWRDQAAAFDPNSIDQQGWIDPQHGRMMAYNHAVQTGNTRVAEALVNPSTMQTYLNPTGIAHGFSRTVLDVASGEIDAMREEEEHKKSSAQGAASFFGSLFR